MELNRTFYEILTEIPELKEFFQARGLPADASDPRAARMKVKSALAYRGIREEEFLAELAAWQAERSAQLKPEGDAATCDLLVRIPCVVQLPVEEALDAHLAAAGSALRHSTALVEFGGAWLSDILALNHPQVILGAGIEGMVNLKALEDAYCAPEGAAYNADYAGMEDPKGLFRILSGIPLVCVVDERRLGGRGIPGSFRELLYGDFEKSLVYPDDGHMLDGILLYYFYAAYGMEGIDRLRRACICGAHPSQMIKFGGLSEHPAVMMMPYIFARIKAREPGMRIVWPEEGAPLIPILMSVRRDIAKEGAAAAGFFGGSEFGRIMIGQGFFPSSHPEVENHLPGKLWFPDWQKIYSDDLAKLIPALKARFLEGGACR